MDPARTPEKQTHKVRGRPRSHWFRVSGLGFRVSGLGFRVLGLEGCTFCAPNMTKPCKLRLELCTETAQKFLVPLRFLLGVLSSILAL